MSSMITNIVSPKASGEPDPGIVQNYKARLQALAGPACAHRAIDRRQDRISPAVESSLRDPHSRGDR